MKISSDMTFHSYPLITKGEDRPQKGRNKSPQDSSFLAINAKEGENIRPKAKGPHHPFSK
jgi:hypothetical protein